MSSEVIGRADWPVDHRIHRDVASPRSETFTSSAAGVLARTRPENKFKNSREVAIVVGCWMRAAVTSNLVDSKQRLRGYE